MTSFSKFVQDEEGLSGAETALLALLGLGLLIFVVKKIKEGADTAAGEAAKELTETKSAGGVW